jgi:hypothetical protein
MTKPLSHLVKDWGGFEDLVKQLHSTGTVRVERNVTLTGSSGAPRQIDVLVTHREGLYDHRIVVECKYWNERVDRQQVDALANTVREVGASAGVIFSVEGFQEGAITQAKFDNIRLFKLREPTDREWGNPGRHIDFWVQMITIALGIPKFPSASTFQGFEPDTLNLHIDFRQTDRTNTPISVTGIDSRTLEDFLELVIRDVSQRIAPTAVLGDPESTEEVVGRIYNVAYVKPPKPIVTLHAGGVLLLPEILLPVGVQVNQIRFQFDRAQDAIFALIVEDCVTQALHAAEKYENQEFAQIREVALSDDVNDDLLQNGSMFHVWLTQFIDLADFENIQPAELVVQLKR